MTASHHPTLCFNLRLYFIDFEEYFLDQDEKKFLKNVQLDTKKHKDHI